MNTDRFKGIMVPLLVPVYADEQVNESKLREMVDFVIDGGVDGILAFGSNSEFYMFTDAELEQIFKIIVEQVNGRVPVLFGMGPIRTSHGVKLAKMAERLHADGISVLQPMFLKPTERELDRHYRAIAGAVPSLPVMIYHNPRVGYSLSSSLIANLAHDVPNIIGMKDSSGDMTFLSEVIRLTNDIEFRTFTGKDTLVFLGLCLGTYGSVCSTANSFPVTLKKIYTAFQAGDYDEARAEQFKLNPARLAQNAASFPVATKDVANIAGMNVGDPILPNLPSTGSVLQNLKAASSDLIKESAQAILK